MRFLLREQTGAFGIDTAVTIEELKSASPEEIASRYLMPLDAPLQHFRQYDVPEIFWKKCLNGVPLTKEEHGLETGEGECIRLYADNDFIGISQAEADGTLTPRMVISKQEGWKKQ
jgi:tRNA U55 pseudouridine synthase TruB